MESVYEKCLFIELKKAGLSVDSQEPITVFYDNEVVGEFVADLIIEDTIILELKSVRQIIRAHEVQLVNYLAATGKPIGLVINFGERKVEIKRKVRELDPVNPVNPVKKIHYASPFNTNSGRRTS